MAYHFNDNVYTKSFTPRDYQVELLDAAKEHNIIVCLGTSSSKIFIATKLIQELANAVRRPFQHGGKRTLYLVDTVAVVAQQASYIRHLTDLSVGEYTSSDEVDMFDTEDWEQEFQENQVLVMTSQICLEIMKCGFMQMNFLNLIILDECHRALREHPMREIMKEFVTCYERPRILGLTAPLLNSTCDPGRLEAEINRLEMVLHSTAETASDIVSVLRYCTKPKELVVECSLPTPGPLDEVLELHIKSAVTFISDHRYDPSEVYEDEFQEELKGIPDPKIDPQKIFNDFLDVLHTLGPWCADRAALVLLIQLEKLKVKTPYERHFLLLCMVSTVMVKIRSICDYIFQKYDEKERIYKFSTPKVLRLLEVLRQFKPEKLPDKKQEECETNALLETEGLKLDVERIGNCASGSTDVAKEEDDIPSNTKVLLAKEIESVGCVEGSQDDLSPNLCNSFISEKTFCCGCEKQRGLVNNIGDIVQEADGVLICPNDVKMSYKSEVLHENVECVNGETCCHLVTCLHESNNIEVLTVDYVQNKLCSNSENEVNIAKVVPSLEKCTSCVSVLSEMKAAQCANIPLLCKELDSNKNSKMSVIEGSISNHSSDGSQSINDCDKIKTSKTETGISKKFSVKSDGGRSIPTTPSKCRTDLYPRNRGSRFSRRGYQKEDGSGPVRGGRNDTAGRQFRNMQQDDLDALCGIVFVEQRFTAKILYHLLNDLRRFDEDFSFLMAQYTVDKVADPVTDPREAEAEHRKQEEVLKRFRMRECNLLVGTSVLEEGIDIPKCNLVIHFNVPKVYRSYVQSKGRARAQDAYLILMIEEDRTQHFINELAQYFEIEQMLLRKCANREPSEEEELEADKFTDLVEAYCPGDSPNSPSVNMATAIALVNRYCAKLPSDTFTRLTPLWTVEVITDNGQISYVCTVRLPINSPVKHDIVGLPMPSKVLARRIAALETCKVLHQAQELDDNLMPVGKESFRVHEEEMTLALEELDEMIPRDSSEPRPGTTKRRQYYYKRIADSLTDCRPVPGQPAYLYHISMVLTCPLPEEQNTRGRKIYPPEDSPQGFGILTLKQIPTICPFPIFTRSGEVSVKLELSESGVVFTPDRLEKIVTFLNYTFTNVLRLQKYLMMFDPQASENSYFIVPTRKFKGSIAEVDWDFLDSIYENRDLRPRPIPENERTNFIFEAEKYHDAVIMPWYRNQDQPQYFYVAEICGHLNPKSSFPGSEYKTFDEYYFKKYGIQIQNSKQPLLDVDHTSARLNFLTPRYVNRKGVALPTSSEETKRAKRENLEQKQILVPELCTLHLFPASLWRKAVCLPCILYRINALLLADEIRREVASCIALGHENLSSSFEWPPLDFGWSLADVLKKSKENAKNAELKEDKKPGEDKAELQSTEEKEEESELKEKSVNEILTEEEKKLRGDWMEIGTWSNDMANHDPMSFSELSDADDFDMNVALPSNLTMVDEDAELAGLHSGGSDWGTGIQARKRRERVRYGSPSSWMGSGRYFGGLEQDLDGFETDDSCSEPGNEYDISDSSDFQGASGLRIEFKSENVAEAIEDEHEVQKRERRRAIIRQNSDISGTEDKIPWDWENYSDDNLDKLTERFVCQFQKATEKNRHFIENSGTLVKSNQALVMTRKGCQQMPLNQNSPSTTCMIRSESNYCTVKNQLAFHELNLPFSRHIKIQSSAVKSALLPSPERLDNNDSGLSEDGSSEEVEVVADEVCNRQFEADICQESDPDKDIISKFSFDAQPDLHGHPGPSPSVILQALTMSNANDGINLERLETIGDSFLKYAITTYLYCTYDNIHEGKLSHLRSKQVSNLNLYRLGRRKVFGESMIATKFEPHDNWLPPCYYVPRELEQALIEAGVPASHWNQADLPALRDLSRDEICKLVHERSEKLHKMSSGEDGVAEDMLTSGPYTNIENLPCFIPYNLITQHSIPDKSVADCVEAMIGAYLIACGPRGALLFMAWLGICVLPKKEVIYTVSCSDTEESRSVGSLLPEIVNGDDGSLTLVQKKQIRYGTLKAPKSPLLRNINSPETELKRLLDGYEVFEHRIGYKFRDQSYLLQSLTHASYSPNRLTDCYQRLEFLGDAVLDYLITRHLYEDSRQHSPGALTDLRSALVNNTIFASLAVRYGFHKYFRHLSPGLNEVVDRFVRIQEENGHTISEEYYLIEEEECEEAEDVEVPKALGDVFESVAGAIFLDSGMSLDAVWRVYYQMMKTEIEQFSTNVPKSPIRELLELEPETAKFGKPEKLADGRRVRVTVEVFGKGTFKGIGRNYRIAKCTAAKCALKQLKKKGLLSRKM
ncbi:endoribonuclease Dcr-1-like isoform X4 [Zootermopsis nevadensis]|nr:endoribonuclease Dcr-1-like isoform X4 [Zootermopsis nevadensis]XP_021929011.1 endoribonuclease Dcr-1-like isoform X4 [Zootermopsis nevadensis]XP_021929012.1 endoribonuclease Dcr-1-like isoform X4 [Zootermopsis nevadensis]XP_021929013.1 endoribonuclease Dcr-1-like isoform X4 [Zootermopsis nevadensis]XP_021929014.1 endoribonuclease Dcr-1-like isoform X4 [Zootermopsis nevadensis]XP_021929015.1 endoribonuclease Dcr-1-like isoform X4 [Zootermopsis nevadensis]XP_021929016.1 endoribonuclease Dcr